MLLLIAYAPSYRFCYAVQIGEGRRHMDLKLKYWRSGKSSDYTGGMTHVLTFLVFIDVLSSISIEKFVKKTMQKSLLLKNI